MSKDDARVGYVELVKNLQLEDEEVSCDEREARLIGRIIINVMNMVYFNKNSIEN